MAKRIFDRSTEELFLPHYEREEAFDVAQFEQAPSFMLGVNRGRMDAVRVEVRFTP
jgi:hypothetical protein